jgi:hypothetical protein
VTRPAAGQFVGDYSCLLRKQFDMVEPRKSQEIN